MRPLTPHPRPALPPRLGPLDVAATTGGTAYAALILFLVLVYANPGNWAEGLEQIGFAKLAAGLGVAALLGAALLYGRRLTLGGSAGLALVGLFAWVGFSSVWSFWPRFTADTFVDGLKYLAIFVLVVNVVDSPSRLEGVVRALAWVSLIPAFGAISSWARGEHLVEGDRAGWIGLFSNPNDLGYHLAIGIGMALAARDATRARAARLLYLGFVLPLGVALLLTQSRGSMLAAVAVVGVWVLRSLRRAAALVGIAAALAGVLAFGPGGVFQRRMETSVAFGEDVSARGRLDAWRTGLRMVEERPLTGVGAGAFAIAWPEFSPGDAGPARTAHNTFVQIASELGLPGLALFLAALVSALAAPRHGLRRGRLAASACGIESGLWGFTVCGFWGGRAFTWPLYILLGLALATRRMARDGAGAPAASPPAPVPGAAMGVPRVRP